MFTYIYTYIYMHNIMYNVACSGIQGAASLAYGQSFGEELETYCVQKCAESSILKKGDAVGCDCRYS